MFQRFHLLRLFLGSAPTSHFTAQSSLQETRPSYIYVGISQTNNDDLPAATRCRRSDERPDGECVHLNGRHDCCWHLRVISHSEARFPLSDPSDVCVPVCVSVCPWVCVLMVLQYLGILPPPIAPSCLVAISNRLIPSASSHFLLSNFTVSTAACGCRAWLLRTSSHWMLLKVKHVVSCCKC